MLNGIGTVLAHRVSVYSKTLVMTFTVALQEVYSYGWSERLDVTLDGTSNSGWTRDNITLDPLKTPALGARRLWMIGSSRMRLRTEASKFGSQLLSVVGSPEPGILAMTEDCVIGDGGVWWCYHSVAILAQVSLFSRESGVGSRGTPVAGPNSFFLLPEGPFLGPELSSTRITRLRHH